MSINLNKMMYYTVLNEFVYISKILINNSEHAVKVCTTFKLLNYAHLSPSIETVYNFSSHTDDR